MNSNWRLSGVRAPSHVRRKGILFCFLLDRREGQTRMAVFASPSNTRTRAGLYYFSFSPTLSCLFAVPPSHRPLLILARSLRAPAARRRHHRRHRHRQQRILITDALHGLSRTSTSACVCACCIPSRTVVRAIIHRDRCTQTPSTPEPRRNVSCARRAQRRERFVLHTRLCRGNES